MLEIEFGLLWKWQDRRIADEQQGLDISAISLKR